MPANAPPVSVTFAVRETGPLVPVVDPEPGTDAGVNVPAAPDGRPVTVTLTVPVNPETGVTVAG